MTNSATQSDADRQNPPEAGNPPVLYFDGVCGLCNRAVDFVLRHDRRATFRFAPLQGETAAANLSGTDTADLNSMVLATQQGTFRRSAAVVRILWLLGSFWWLLGWMLWVVPAPLRNIGYNFVARVRYRVFGKRETCRLPAPEERERFLP